MYLCRALAYSGMGGSIGWQKVIWDDILHKALNDIDTAEALGIKDYRINMYRATVLQKLEKYNDAMKEIDLAILKNNTYPGCFRIRYDIRIKLKQVEWNNRDDIDLVQLRKLAEDWTWEKW